jgi:hypothetical protein
MGAFKMATAKVESFLQSTSIPDPFDPAALRIKPDFVESAGVKKLLTTVPARKPGKHDFIRVHDSPDFRDTFGLIQLGEDREFYLITPAMAGELAGEYQFYTVYTCINRQGVVFLWPVRLPDPDGKKNEWWTSAHEAAVAAMGSWVRVTSNMSLRAYEIRVATNIMTKPEWPDVSFGELLRIAFKDLSDDTFRQQARSHPIVAPLRELRSSLSELRLHDLIVGNDGRNRTILSAFRARTSRNQPSNSKFIFGPSVWIRGLIKPPPGHALAYIDWSQQEFGIAAALSGCGAMLEAYLSGDAYLAFAKQAGAIPAHGTKKTHKSIRELYKQASLAVLYGMGEWGLAGRIGEPPLVARNLLGAHRQVNHRFWEWSEAAVESAVLTGSLQTVFGWTVHVGKDFNARSLMNFPMQANGAEMLRLAACLATERGVEVCAPVHDALLICAPFHRFEADIATTRAAMAEASRIVLDGFELRTGDEDGDVCRVVWPNRYSDPRRKRMWETVNRLMDAASRQPIQARLL